MGQVSGKAQIKPEVLPFVNLPRDVVSELRESCNDIAEGYGLNLQEFQSIVSVSTKEHVMYTDGRMAASAEALFRRFDDDCNGLVDSFEFLSSLGLASSMTTEEKASYIFEVCHFGEPGVLTISEVTLAFRASVGLCKISGFERPSDTEIDLVALVPFQTTTEPQKQIDEQSTIKKEEFVRFVAKNPVVSSWVNYFADLSKAE